MKKLLLILILLGLANSGYANSSTDYHGSGSVIASTNIAAVSGRCNVINNITAYSDLSGSFLDIFIGAEAGVTTTYTQVARLNLGSSTLAWDSGYTAPVGYLVRVSLNSTAKNSLIVNWNRE